MIGFHVTSKKKFLKYKQTGGILPPVRFWPNIQTATRWAKRTKRDTILKIEYEICYPMPDHKPAKWSPEIIRNFELEQT